jgi:hypothetical protein
LLRNVLQFIAYDSKPSLATFPRFPAYLLMFRCWLGVVLGTALGSSSKAGLSTFMSCMLIIVVLPEKWCTLYLGIDTDKLSAAIDKKEAARDAADDIMMTIKEDKMKSSNGGGAAAAAAEVKKQVKYAKR